MRPFAMIEPRDLDEACVALAEHEGAKVIAGGSALVIMMKQGLVMPNLLVNLAKIVGFDRVEVLDDVIRIGGLTTMSAIEADPSVREHLPVLVSACHAVANIRIRNVATIGGNLAHADYQADPPTALLALDAEVELRSVRGSRRVPLEQFLVGAYATAIEADEILAAVRIPVPSDPPISWAYSKFTTKSSEDRPCAGVAAALSGQEGACTGIRVAVGAATVRPVRFRDLEATAIGRPLGRELFEEVALGASKAIDPVEDLNGDGRYKRQVVRALVARSLHTCDLKRERG